MILRKYRNPIIWILATIPPLVGVIWNYNFQNLFPNKVLTPESIWQIRMVLSLISPSMYLLTFLILAIYSYDRDIKRRQSFPEEQSNIEEPKPLKIDDKILHSVAKLRTLNTKPTPSKIAEDINETPDVVLAHMMKLHNQQFITFYSTEGNPTHHETPFFLSPKAMGHIKITIDKTT